jgi:23S rRNA (guanine745-N1)-methyltransferase
VQFLICPVCGAGLAEADGALKCPLAHSFDIAREGYVNLLLMGRKRPKVLGDTREMLRARRDFLGRGLYEPLSDAINERVCGYLVDASSACIADVGCGEGYYIGRLKHYLDGQQAWDDICYFGLDVSKEAARLAAKRYKAVRFIVGDVNRNVLFADRSIRVLLDVFAPRNAVEFDRVVAQDGVLLVVIPGPGHLANLRSEFDLLSIEPDKQRRVVEQFAGAFRLAGEYPIAYQISLDGADIFNLIRMTPNYWHSSKETLDRAKTMGNARTEVDFTILEFHR